MKFEDSLLTTYLVKSLQPLTEADPVILAEYVIALLKKDKSIKELQKLCAEKLLEFLGQGTESFITKLFQALEDGSVAAPAKSSDATVKVEPSASFIAEGPVQQKSSALIPEVPGSASDPDEKEVSDDDDDDRNHKHRRRETRSQSFDKDMQGHTLRRANRKHGKPFENGQMSFGNDPQSSDNKKEYNPASLERDFSARFDKRRSALVPLPRTAYDMGFRGRVNQAFHGDPGHQFDLSTSLSRLPIGRGRGRGSVPWNQHDLKFSSMDTLDFASQMPPQGPPPASLFGGRGLQPFGMIPGMANGGLEAMHPLGMQGPLGPHINQSMSIGMARQRCRDFEERGFCLRGDMCPMEHGVNRIVVEDVQSLSQFNLPVSLPSGHNLGTAPGAGSLHLGGGPTSLQANNKSLSTNSNKNGIGDNGFGMNRVSSAAAGTSEADLYDPDQPLWNNNHLSSPKVDDADTIWNGDPPERHGFGSSDGFEGEHPCRTIASAVGSQSTSSSVWGRIRNSENKLVTPGNTDTSIASMDSLRDETKVKEEALSSVPATSNQKKRFTSENVGSRSSGSAANPRLRNEAARHNGRTSQKALRTLFVNGIPSNCNKREILLSHFRKFGQVIDIYIPLNSEKAFVQFSKRDEAEAALKAPDAVLGNRFIKLWWANRDSISDNGLNIGDAVSSGHQGVAASVLFQQTVVDKRKESLSPTVSKLSAAPLSDNPVSTTVVCPSLTNVPKATLPQKKLDSLELLKEELRLKQEMLDKKRNDFRRQLDMLEKKAIKVEPNTEQAAKRQKVGMGTVVKSTTSSPINTSTTGCHPGVEKTLEKTHSGESSGSPNSKPSSTPVQQSPKNPKNARPTVPVGALAVAKRFKLDNRPTTFRILPPLPAGFSNVVILKEHFSTYGDITTVELEDLEAESGCASSEPSGNRAARITFTTRRSAEMAFSNGKCWKSHNLKFSWVALHSSSTNSHNGRENSPTPTTTAKGNSDAEALAETAASASLSVMEEPTSSGSQAAPSIGNAEPVDLLELHHSTKTPLASCQTLSPKADIPIAEDGLDVGNVL